MEFSCLKFQQLRRSKQTFVWVAFYSAVPKVCSGHSFALRKTSLTIAVIKSWYVVVDRLFRFLHFSFTCMIYFFFSLYFFINWIRWLKATPIDFCTLNILINDIETPFETHIYKTHRLCVRSIFIHLSKSIVNDLLVTLDQFYFSVWVTRF
jgi:hypothetical protein